MKKKLALYSVLTAILALLFAVGTAIPQGLNYVSPWLLQNHIWPFNRGIATPLRVGSDYTILDPTLAPTAADNGTGGSCTTTGGATLEFGYVWLNLAGTSALSPPSSAYTTNQSFRKVNVIRSESAPAGATFWAPVWAKSSEGFANWRACASGTFDTNKQALGTTTVSCSCGSSGTLWTAKTTGPIGLTNINVEGPGIISNGNTGATIGSYTEGNRRFSIAGNFPTWSSDSGVTTTNLALKSPSVVTVCNAGGGCDYTSLNAACAAKTSTASVPLTFLIGPGLITSGAESSCTGQDHPSFIGYGQGATILDNGTNHGIDLIGSTNWTVADMTISAGRPIVFGTNSGGLMWVQNVDMIQNDAIGITGDCIKDLGTGTLAGSELHVDNSRCGIVADGITVVNDTNLSLYSSNNFFYLKAGAITTGNNTGFFLSAIPCTFVSIGDRFEASITYTVNNVFTVYDFVGGDTGCASNATAEIKDAVVNVLNSSAAGKNSTVAALGISATATELSSVRISGMSADIAVPNDTSTGTSVGLDNSSESTTVVSLYGSRIRATGGQIGTRFDLKANGLGSILTKGVDWLLDNGLIQPIPVPFETTRIFTQTSVQGGDTLSGSTSTQAYATTATIPAGLLNAVGRHIHLVSRGVATTPAGPATMGFRMWLDGTGGTSLLSNSGITPTANQTNKGWYEEADCTTITTGSSGTIECQGHMGRPLDSHSVFQNAATITVNLTTSHTIGAGLSVFGSADGSSWTQRELIVTVD